MKLKYLILSAIASGLMLTACGPQNGPEDRLPEEENKLPEVLRSSIGEYLNDQVIYLNAYKKVPRPNGSFDCVFDKNMAPFKVVVNASKGEHEFTGTLEKSGSRVKLAYSGSSTGATYYDFCYNDDELTDSYYIHDNDYPICYIADNYYSGEVITSEIMLDVEDHIWTNYFCQDNFNYAEVYTISETDSTIKFHFEDSSTGKIRSFTMDKNYNLLSAKIVEGDLTYNIEKQAFNGEITIPNFDYPLSYVFKNSDNYSIKSSNHVAYNFSQKIKYLDDDNAEIYSPTYIYNDEEITQVSGEHSICSFTKFAKYNTDDHNYTIYQNFEGTNVKETADNDSKIMVGIDSDYNSLISSVVYSIDFDSESIYALENWQKVDDKIYQLTPSTGTVDKYIIYISNKGYIEKVETYFRNVQHGVFDGIKTQICELYDIGITNIDFNEDTSVDVRTYLEKGFDLAVQNPTKVIVTEDSGAWTVNNTYTGYEISFDISDASKDVYRLKDTGGNETVYVHSISEGTYVRYMAGTSTPIDETSFNTEAEVAIDIANRFKELSTYDLSNISNINVSWRDFSLSSQSSEEYGSQSIRVKLSGSYFDSDFFINELNTSVSDLLTGNYFVVQKTSINL